MKKLIIIVGLILLVAIIAFVALSSQSQISSQKESTYLKWHTDINSALDEAKKTNKPIFVDFYTNWCPYCKQLDETTFSDPRVKAKLTKDYIVAKIDADKYPDVASNYRIYGYPTLLFLNSDGKEIKRIGSYVDANTLLNQL